MQSGWSALRTGTGSRPLISIWNQPFSSVPAKPDATMLARGARAAGVSVEVAWKIYRAMVLNED